MEIVKIETFRVRVPRRSGWGDAYAARNAKGELAAHSLRLSSDYLILKMHTDEGLVGLGEASPVFPWPPAEALEATIKVNVESILAGMDPMNVEGVRVLLSKSLRDIPYCAAGILMCTYDLVGKTLKTPLYQLLGGCYRERVEVTHDIGTKDPKLMAIEALDLVEKGWRTVKLKGGLYSPKHDFEAVKTVREAVGDEVNIRLDPNEAWTAKTAMKMSEKLARYDLECLEQPVPSRDIDGLAKIARSVETPVMAHQSLSSSPKALELIEKEAADMFNVCPAWYGLCEAKTIVGIAEAAGIPCCIGSSIDLGIADACHTHLGASSKDVELASDIVGWYHNKDDLITKELEIKNGCVTVPKGLGLGVELDEKAVAKYGWREPLLTSG